MENLPKERDECDLGGNNAGKLNGMSSAMQNNVILTTIFKHCPLKILTKCRLVSKLWHDLSLPFWRSSVFVRFDVEEYSKFWTDDCSVSKFCKFVKNPKNKCAKYPYKQFSLACWEFKWNLNNELINQFWVTCSNTISSLDVCGCDFEGVRGFRQLMFSCTNLQRLIVLCCTYKHVTLPSDEENYKEPNYGELLQLKTLIFDMDYQTLPVPWIDVFSHFPKLTTFKLSKPAYDNSVEVMLQTIKNIRKEDSQKLVLKDLNLLSTDLVDKPVYERDYMSREIGTLLTELQLPLETLTIEFGADTPRKLAKEIVEIHAPTLRVLKINRKPDSIPYKRFPSEVQLDSLHKLYLSDGLCSNMEFIKFTPNLQVLHICNQTYNYPTYEPTKIVYNTWEPELTNVSLVHLTDLNIEYVVSEDDIRNLGKWMPNVEKLRMILNDKQFAVVCENWRKLVHLDIYGSGLTDEGVTGKRFYQEDEDGEEIEFPSTRSNIKCLKDLKTFAISKDTGTRKPTKLKDLSAFHGFLKAESLQHLSVHAQMGVKAMEALKQKIPHCKLRRF